MVIYLIFLASISILRPSSAAAVTTLMLGEILSVRHHLHQGLRKLLQTFLKHEFKTEEFRS